MAKTVVFLLVGVAVLYLVGMNVFLRTRLFRDAIGFDPNMLVVDYSSAYSVWPGSIHVEGLDIRGRDSNVEWILHLDRCDFAVSFMDLAHQKFHADHVRGDGLSFRVRLRRTEVSAETMSALAPVPGFDYPPLRDVGPENPPLTDATYNLWSVELDDVVASHVRELWIDTVRTAGDMEIRGRWVFRPMRWLDVGPATIDIHALDVSFGRVESWVSDLTGRLVVTVHPFSLVTVLGSSIVDQVSLLGDTSGMVQGATVANRVLRGEGVAVTHATAPFQLRAVVDHGRVRAGTQLLTAPFETHLTAAGLAFEASIQADAQVDGDGVGYADLRVVDARAGSAGQERAHVKHIAVTLVSRDLDLAEEFFSAPLYAIDIDAAETGSLAYWRSRIPGFPDIHVLAGAATVGGRLEGAVREQTGKGHVALGVHALAVTRGETRLDLDAVGTVRFDGSLAKEQVALSGTELSFHDVRLAHPDASIHAKSLDLHVRSLAITRSAIAGQVGFGAEALAVAHGSAHVLGNAAGIVRMSVGGSPAGKHLQLAGSEITLRDVHATWNGVDVDAPSMVARVERLGLDGTGLAGRVALDVPLVEVPSLVAVGALLPLPADITIEGGRGMVGVALVIDLSRKVATGQIALAARDLKLRVGALPMEGDLTVSLHAKASGDVTDLSGTEVDFKQVGSAESTPGWWGRVSLRRASLAFLPRLRFQTYLSAAAQDGSPLTALVTDTGAVPKWLLDLVSTKGLEATGELFVTPSLFAVRSVRADAEGANVGFEFGKVGQVRKEWALLLDLGVVLAGIDVVNGQSQVVLFGAGSWFKAKVAMLESVERREE